MITVCPECGGLVGKEEIIAEVPGLRRELILTVIYCIEDKDSLVEAWEPCTWVTVDGWDWGADLAAAEGDVLTIPSYLAPLVTPEWPKESEEGET